MAKTYTEAMYETSTPFDNPYQGTDKKVLFVCTAGLLRSPTAARIYAHMYNTRSAGSDPRFALIPVTSSLLLWADEVVFVNKENYNQVNDDFKLDDFPCHIVVLNVPDRYAHMHPKLVEHFNEHYKKIE